MTIFPPRRGLDSRMPTWPASSRVRSRQPSSRQSASSCARALRRICLTPARSLSASPSSRSPERETESLSAGIEKLDLEPAVADRLRLPDQLIHPLLHDGAVAFGVDVGTVR